MKRCRGSFLPRTARRRARSASRRRRTGDRGPAPPRYCRARRRDRRRSASRRRLRGESSSADRAAGAAPRIRRVPDIPNTGAARRSAETKFTPARRAASESGPAAAERPRVSSVPGPSRVLKLTAGASRLCAPPGASANRLANSDVSSGVSRNESASDPSAATSVTNVRPAASGSRRVTMSGPLFAGLTYPENVGDEGAAE